MTLDRRCRVHRACGGDISHHSGGDEQRATFSVDCQKVGRLFAVILEINGDDYERGRVGSVSEKISIPRKALYT
jgi:hypothetical protein